jgi:ABC-2 type transport system permease protein
VVAHFVRLKLTLLGNTLRRSVWQTIGLAVALLYGLTVVTLLVGAAVAVGRDDPVLVGQVLTVVGALVVLGWWVVPLFAFGIDSTLDPLRFVTFGIPRRQLLAGLAVAGAVSVPAAVTLLAGLGAAFAWASDPAALVAALVGAVTAFALCVVGSRATTTLLAPLLDSRRYREILMVVAVVPLLAIGPVFAWLGSSSTDRQVDGSTVTVTTTGPGEELLAGLTTVADVAAWTPFGAPWALAGAVHDGAWWVALARLAVVALTLALALLVWDRALARTLVTPRGDGAPASSRRGLGWFARLPATPTGAVAARCATYWLRDPRYAASLAMVPLLPLVMVAVGMSSGAGTALLLAVAPIAAFILGIGPSNDVGFDSTAFGLHVAAGVPGRADRWGRVVPVAVVGVPLVAAFAVAAVLVSGRWDALPALLGVSLGVLGVGLGVSSVASARLVYPVPKPGESAFKTPQGATMATLVAQMIAFAIVAVLMAPTVVLGALGIFGAGAVFGWVALAVGLLSAGAVLVLGVRWGARVYERRLPELLSQVAAFA